MQDLYHTDPIQIPLGKHVRKSRVKQYIVQIVSSRDLSAQTDLDHKMGILPICPVCEVGYGQVAQRGGGGGGGGEGLACGQAKVA